MRKLGEETNWAGVKTSVYEADNKLIIENSQDISAVLESNKSRYAATDERAKWSEFEHIGWIPDSVIIELNRQSILRGYAVVDEKKFKAWLNNPDNRYFRSRPGRV
jgi:hypothetical protein